MKQVETVRAEVVITFPYSDQDKKRAKIMASLALIEYIKPFIDVTEKLPEQYEKTPPYVMATLQLNIDTEKLKR